MSSLTVTFIQTDGVERTIENAKPGWTLMEAARANGVAGILADCGGGCACATCHVYVDPKWLEAVGAPDDIEAEVLEMVSDVRHSNSRLSCQIKLTPELDGIRLTVAPEA
jgi:2Fe-2S ferredoxin